MIFSRPGERESASAGPLTTTIRQNVGRIASGGRVVGISIGQGPALGGDVGQEAQEVAGDLIGYESTEGRRERPRPDDSG